MSWSNGAEDSGVHRMNFTSGGIDYTNTIVCNTAANVFETENKSLSKTECEKALEEQNKKDSIQWFSIQPD